MKKETYIIAVIEVLLLIISLFQIYVVKSFNYPIYLLILFVILELGLAIFLAARIHKMQPTTARICYLLYSFITGLTFASLFVVYKLESIILVFAITAVLFLIFALIGSKTKMDLSKLGTYLIMMLIGIILCTIVNLFLQNSTFDFISPTFGQYQCSIFSRHSSDSL